MQCFLGLFVNTVLFLSCLSLLTLRDAWAHMLGGVRVRYIELFVSKILEMAV